jgi:hypothetical protein
MHLNLPKLVDLLYLWKEENKFYTENLYFHILTSPIERKFQHYFIKGLKKSHTIVSKSPIQYWKGINLWYKLWVNDLPTF